MRGKKVSEHKPLYAINEAAELLHVSVGGLYQMVQQGKVPSKRIGKRILVPGTYIYGEEIKQAREEQLAKLETQGDEILETVKPEFLKLLASAPDYGSCGITITFHGGKVTRISTQTEISRLAGSVDPARQKAETA
jgi:excisionase family DNA binding protein